MEGHDEAHVVGMYIQYIDTYTYTYAKDEHQNMVAASNIGSQEAVMYAQYIYICTVLEFFEYNKERGCEIRMCYE